MAEITSQSGAMDGGEPQKGDSGAAEPMVPAQPGGTIPGAPEAWPAFDLYARHPSPIPILISVPHAGRHYPPALLARMRMPSDAALRLEDRLVDHLGEAIAARTGASLLLARAPRALLDLNRAAADVDWDMLNMPAMAQDVPNGRARSGLGLVPRRLPGTGEIWRGGLTYAEVQERIAAVHRPYHHALSTTLESLRRRWGAALLIDLHSMPPLPRVAGRNPAQIVLGDRFGVTCHGALAATCFAHFAQAGAAAAHNRPYAGGYVLDSHAAPDRGIHAFQWEIDRAAYLDSAMVGLGDGFAAMADMLTALVRKLGRDVARLGGAQAGENWPEAAE